MKIIVHACVMCNCIPSEWLTHCVSPWKENIYLLMYYLFVLKAQSFDCP